MPPDYAPAPGSPTVPPLAGWEGVVVALLAVLVVGLVFLAAGALATAARRPSPEWEAWLAGRSRGGPDPTSPAPGPPVEGAPDDGVGRYGPPARR